jgi:membrane-associated phospholipid phosphatase
VGRSTRLLLLGALGCGVLFTLVLVAAYADGPGSRLDLHALQGFVDLQSPTVERLTDAAAGLGDPPSVGLIAVALASVALARGRPRVALLIIVLLAATSVSSQVLKALLAHPRESWEAGAQVAPRAYPSGHATAAMSLALAAVLAAPRRARPAAAALGTALALAVGFSISSLGWHFPSDVLGGYLLATGWALVLVAGLLEVDRRHPAAAAESRWNAVADRISAGGMAAGAVALTAAGTLAVAVVLLTRTPQLADFAVDHTSSALVLAGLTAAAVVLPAGLALALRR